MSKGTASDRNYTRLLTNLEDGDGYLANLQTWEMMDIERSPQSFDEINASVAKAARLDVHFSPEVKVVNNKTSKSATKQTPPPAVQSKKIPPCYIISTLVPSEVHRLTGFADIIQMLSFAIILCEGDINLLTATTSALTWLEEWVLYFEFAYGRTTI